jgi:ABC-type sugar transport system substrate-binding protein
MYIPRFLCSSCRSRAARATLRSRSAVFTIRLISSLVGLCLSGVAVQTTLAQAADRTQLVVYSTLEADFLGELKKAFEAEHPDLSIVWQKDLEPRPGHTGNAP